jgi:hypothetical protein
VDDGGSEKQGLRASSFKPQVQDWLRVMVEAKENEKLNKLLFGILFVHTSLTELKSYFEPPPSPSIAAKMVQMFKRPLCFNPSLS